MYLNSLVFQISRFFQMRPMSCCQFSTGLLTTNIRRLCRLLIGQIQAKLRDFTELPTRSGNTDCSHPKLEGRDCQLLEQGDTPLYLPQSSLNQSFQTSTTRGWHRIRSVQIQKWREIQIVDLGDYHQMAGIE